MFDFIKSAGIATVVALAPFAASAAIVPLSDGDSLTINPNDTYTYEEILTGSGGFQMRMFEFKANAADTPMAVNATQLTLTGLGSITGAEMYWEYGGTRIDGVLTNLPGLGIGIVADTVFTAPDAQVQKLTIAWQAYSGPVQVSLQVNGETSPVPVPAAGLLLLSALGGAVALRRKS